MEIPARPLLAEILDSLATRLAGQAGVDRSAVVIGPVDFGEEHGGGEHRE